MAGTKKGTAIVKTGIKKAAASTAARENDQWETTYYIPADKSSEKLKERIGELLLYLQRPLNQAERQICWIDFDLLLRQYLLSVKGERL